jgi:polyhydroxyalkanoate synthesis repressor PhaR
MDRKRVVIRKYENRRLYDTAASRYVNLDEVAEMVRKGVDIQVVDAATGEDLTRVVLTQIIVESAREPGSGFPVDILRQMVMASGRAGQEGMLRSMRALFEMYQNAYRTFVSPLTPFNLMGSMGQHRPEGAEPSAPASAAAAPQGPAEHADVAELRRRLEELEGRLAPRKPRRKATVKKRARK